MYISSMSMLSKFFKILVTLVLIAIVALILGFVALIIWSNGDQKKVPTSVVSKIEDAFEALSPDIQVYVGGAKMQFLGFDEGFEIMLSDSYIQFGPEVLASAPRMRVDLKLKDLLFFNVKLGELRLYNPQFVVSSTQGSEVLDVSKQDSFLSIYKSVIYELFAAINKENNVIPVEKVDMEGAKFSFNNKGVYETWDLRKAELKFFKLQDSTYLQTEVQTEIYGDIVDVVSKARLLEGGRMMVDIDFQNLPSKITTLFVDDVEWLKDLDINISGKSTIAMNKENVESSISLDTGFNFNKKGLGDIELDYKGILNLVEREGVISPILKSDITLNNLEMRKLKDIWPEDYGGDVRDEVLKRVSKGIYKDIQISFEFGFADTDFNSVISEDYSVSGHLSSADVIFNPRFPTIKDVEGYFEFDGENVIGEIKKAQIKNQLNFADTKLKLSDINADESILEVEGKILGDIIAVKHFVNAAMRGKNKGDFYNTRKIKAIGSGDFYYKDDINDGFNYKNTKLKIDAEITDLSVENVVDGINLTSDRADLLADENGLTINSEGLLNASPAIAKVWVGFRGKNNYKINLSAEANEADIAEIVDGFNEYVEGKTNLEFEYKSEGKTNSLIGKLDFLDAKIDFPYISWKKPLGKFSTISFIGRNAYFKALEIKNIQLTTEDSVSTGRAIIALDRDTSNEVYFNSLRAAGNDAELYYSSSKIKDKKGKNIGFADIVKVNGKLFNASGVLTTLKGSGGGNSSILLDANVKNLIMSDGVVFNNFTANLKCAFRMCLSGTASSEIGGGGSMNMDFYPKNQSDPYGQRLFNLETDNAGALTKAFGILSDNIKGGYLKISSITDESLQDKTNGKISMKNYQIIKAPVLAKIFSLASFSGISELLTGSGIPMRTLDGNFKMNDDFLSFENITSSGNSLGITAQGRYDFENSSIDLSGAVTPSYSINSFFGKIPILGKIFTAKEGEGLIAAKYSVEGKYPNVEVSVNPLSAFTPGFLRRIWGNSSTDINTKSKNKKDHDVFPKKRN